MYLLSTSRTLPFSMLTASSTPLPFSSPLCYWSYAPIFWMDLSRVGMTYCDLCFFSLFLIYSSPLAVSHLRAFSELILVISCTLSCSSAFCPRIRSTVVLASLSSRINLSRSFRSYSSMMLPAFSLSARAVLISLSSLTLSNSRSATFLSLKTISSLASYSSFLTRFSSRSLSLRRNSSLRADWFSSMSLSRCTSAL